MSCGQQSVQGSLLTFSQPSCLSWPPHPAWDRLFRLCFQQQNRHCLSKALLNALVPVLGIKWTFIDWKYDVFCASVLEIWEGTPRKVSLCLRNSSTIGRCVNVKLYSNLEVRFEATSGLHWQSELVVKTLCFQYRRQRFDLWPGNWDPTYCVVQPKEKKSNPNLPGND